MSSNLMSGSGSEELVVGGRQAAPRAGGVPRVGDITRGEERPLTITPPTLPNFWRRREWSNGKNGSIHNLIIKHAYKEYFVYYISSFIRFLPFLDNWTITGIHSNEVQTSGVLGVRGRPSLALRSCTWSVRSWFDRCKLVFLSARNLRRATRK